MDLTLTNQAVVAEKWARLRAQAKPVRFLASRFLWHSGLCSLFTIPCDTFRLHFYPTACSATLWLNPDERLVDERIICGLLRDGDSMIDVGANIGAITLAAAQKVGAKGKVYSIEAHPRTYKYLLGNVNLNYAQNVKTINIACGANAGVAFFSDKKSDDQNLVSSQGLTVSMKRLDEILPPDEDIALLKIDVEGYEKFVLKGATGLLPRVQTIYLESCKQHFHNFGYCLRDIRNLLQPFGFTIYRLDGQPVPDNYESIVCENLLAKRN